MDLKEYIRQGDESALKDLMHQYGDYLLRTAFLLMKDRHEAEEIVQETFITAFQKIDQLEDDSKLKSWLTTITVNHARSRLRKWGFKHILLKFDPVKADMDMGEVNFPEDNLIKKLEMASLHNAIRRLKDEDRELITLYYFAEWKVEEIATNLHQNGNTVKSRLMRARKKLKSLLSEGGMDREEA